MKFSYDSVGNIKCYQRGVGALLIPAHVLASRHGGNKSALAEFLSTQHVCSCCVPMFVRDVEVFIESDIGRKTAPTYESVPSADSLIPWEIGISFKK